MLSGLTNLYGRVLGSFGAGHIVNKIGRKNSILISLVLNTMAWIIITYFSYNVEILYVGRVLSGVACGNVIFSFATMLKILWMMKKDDFHS